MLKKPPKFSAWLWKTDIRFVEGSSVTPPLILSFLSFFLRKSVTASAKMPKLTRLKVAKRVYIGQDDHSFYREKGGLEKSQK